MINDKSALDLLKDARVVKFIEAIKSPDISQKPSAPNDEVPASPIVPSAGELAPSSQVAEPTKDPSAAMPPGAVFK
jgi:hypothetical protein